MSQHRRWNAPTSELQSLEATLTGAARERLDQHLRELRLRILREAEVWRPAADGTAEKTGVKDIKDAIARVTASDARLNSATSDVLLALRALQLPFLTVTILTAALGVGLSIVGWGSEFAVPMALALGALASLLVLGSTFFAFEIVRARRLAAERETLALSRDFVRRMARLEERCIATATKLGGNLDSRGKLTLSAAHDALVEADVWTMADVLVHRQLIGYRNMIVHEDALSLGADELAFGTAEISRLRALLEKQHEVNDDPR